jgi:hypothetical protein
MRTRFTLLCLVVAVAACDRVTSPSLRDAGPDSLASLWEQVDAGGVNYNAVAGSAPENVFIVGDQGTILHWDGLALMPEASGTTANLRGIAVVDPTLAYAVGDQGTILHRQDGVWIVDPPISAAVLNGVWGQGTVAVAAGEQGTILVGNASVWKAVPNTRSDNYYAVTSSGDGVEIVGALGVVVGIDPGTGALRGTTTIPGYTKVLAGGAQYSAGAFFVGVDGGLFYFAKQSATRLAGLPQKFLRAVSVIGDVAWIVGHEGLVATAGLSAPPTVVPTPDDRWLLGVYAATATDVWVVGRSGLVMRGPPGLRGPIDGGTP